MSLNFVDLIILLIIVLCALNGYRRGFIIGVLDLVGWIVILLAGLRFYQPVAHWLRTYLASWSDVWDQPLAFILVAVIVGAIVRSLEYALLTRLPRDIHVRAFNKLLGVIPGLAYGIITAAIVSALLLALPLNERLHERARDSALVNRLSVYAQRLEATLHPVFGEAIARTLNLLTVQPESTDRVELPFRVTNTRPLPNAEAELLELVNQERVAAGLRPLVHDPELMEVARRHSADMLARGYFAHITPEGFDPFDRMREAGVTFLIAGENLALARTVELAHNGLMNSPGHRANILRPQFGRVGIGIMDGGLRGLMVTQKFRN